MRGPAMAHQFRLDVHALSQIGQRRNPPPPIGMSAMLERSAGPDAETGATRAFPDLAAWTALPLMMETVVQLAVLIIPLPLLCE